MRGELHAQTDRVEMDKLRQRLQTKTDSNRERWREVEQEREAENWKEADFIMESR